MVARNYLVQTTVGNSVLPAGTRYFSSLGNDAFVEKHIEDLTEGELVLYAKEGVDKTLEEVEPSLEKSARYRAALQKLFVQNSAGKRSPVFRRDLIQSLAASGVVQSPGLEAKIMREGGDDFEPAEYHRMAEHVKLKLDDFCRDNDLESRSITAVRDWLTGETLAPSDWRLFYALAQTINEPVFGEYFAPAPGSDSYEKNYKLWKTVRSGVMGYLAQFAGKNSGSGREGKEGKKEGNGQKLSIAPEIAAVVHDFMEEINEQSVVARVLDVKELREGNGASGKEAPEAKLRKGVVTKNEGYNLVSVPDAYKWYEVLNHAARGLYVAYLEHMIRDHAGKNFLETGEKVLARRLAAGFQSTLLWEDGLLHPIDREKSPEQLEDLAKSDNHLASELTGKSYTDFRESLYNGTVDAALKLPQGTAAKLVTASKRAVKVLPDCVFQIPLWNFKLQNAKSRDDRRTAELGFRHTLSKAAKYYFRPDTSRFILSSSLQAYIRDYTPHPTFDMVSVLETDQELLKQFVRRISLDKGVDLRKVALTRAEASSVLKQAGVPEAIRFIHPNNFILEAI